MLLRHCCIVAVCGNKVECCFDKVERSFDNVTCCFDIVADVDGPYRRRQTTDDDGATTDDRRQRENNTGLLGGPVIRLTLLYRNFDTTYLLFMHVGQSVKRLLYALSVIFGGSHLVSCDATRVTQQ